MLKQCQVDRPEDRIYLLLYGAVAAEGQDARLSTSPKALRAAPSSHYSLPWVLCQEHYGMANRQGPEQCWVFCSKLAYPWEPGLELWLLCTAINNLTDLLTSREVKVVNDWNCYVKKKPYSFLWRQLIKGQIISLWTAQDLSSDAGLFMPNTVATACSWDEVGSWVSFQWDMCGSKPFQIVFSLWVACNLPTMMIWVAEREGDSLPFKMT